MDLFIFGKPSPGGKMTKKMNHEAEAGGLRIPAENIAEAVAIYRPR